MSLLFTDSCYDSIPKTFEDDLCYKNFKLSPIRNSHNYALSNGFSPTPSLGKGNLGGFNIQNKYMVYIVISEGSV